MPRSQQIPALQSLFRVDLQRVEGATVVEPPELRDALLKTASDARLIQYDYPQWSRHPLAGLAVRRYDPLAEPDLYERFARLRFQDTEEVERFADRYGPLGKEQRFQNANGEPVGRWRWVAKRLRTLMALRAALGKAREDSFHKAFKSLVQRTRDHGTVYYVLPSMMVMQFPKESLRSAVTRAIIQVLSEELGQVRIAPAAAPNAEDSAHAVSTEGGRGLLELGWGVPSLRAALFLQLYLDLLGNIRFRTCKAKDCGMPFPESRKEREYCSDRCSGRERQRRLYRRRMQTRRRLRRHSSGTA